MNVKQLFDRPDKSVERHLFAHQCAQLDLLLLTDVLVVSGDDRIDNNSPDCLDHPHVVQIREDVLRDRAQVQVDTEDGDVRGKYDSEERTRGDEGRQHDGEDDLR